MKCGDFVQKLGRRNIILMPCMIEVNNEINNKTLCTTNDFGKKKRKLLRLK